MLGRPPGRGEAPQPPSQTKEGRGCVLGRARKRRASTWIQTHTPTQLAAGRHSGLQLYSIDTPTLATPGHHVNTTPWEPWHGQTNLTPMGTHNTTDTRTHNSRQALKAIATPRHHGVTHAGTEASRQCPRRHLRATQILVHTEAQTSQSKLATSSDTATPRHGTWDDARQ